MSISRFISKIKEVSNFKRPLDYVRLLYDGSLWVTLVEKGPTGTLVGEDKFGNKYYEDETTSYNRKRWVVYANLDTYNPTVVPPEWHGWLNYINDFAPTRHEFKTPIYAIDAGEHKTGTIECYAPKGSWVNPDKRCWLKSEAWQPPSSKSV